MTKRRERVEPGIYRRPDGKLEIGFRDATGAQRWRVVDGGVVAARKQLIAAKAQRDRGDRVAVDPRLTFDRAANTWLAARVARLRPHTQVTYGAHLAHLRARWGRAKLSAISPTDVASYVAQIDREGAKGWTQRGRLTVLSGVFTYAGRHLGHAGVNPVSLLDRVERPDIDDEREHVIVSTDEIAQIVANAGHHELLLTVATQTGARKAEVLGLAWQDVDVPGRALEIACQLDRAGERRPLKTKRSRRRVTIPTELARALAQAKLAAESELVFHREDGAWYQPMAADYALRRACERAGVEPAPTWHDLRHSHVSMLFAAGWDPVAIAARIGDSVETVLSVYAHEYDAARRRASESDELGALYGSAMEAPNASTRPSVTPPARSNVARLRRSDTG
jgi:integrase